MNSKLLNFLGKLNPAVFDTIPRGPQAVMFGQIAGQKRRLNPQPLPPADAYVLASVELAYEIARIAAAGEVAGTSAAGSLANIFDDWCGTVWPRPFPWPH